MPAPIIELRDVSKHFGEGDTRVDALRSVSLSVAPGEVIALLGPSGSGKTTLLNVIGCILEPSSGWVRLDDEVIYDGKMLRRDLRRLRLEKIGFIFQFHNLLPFLDATDNVAVAMELAGKSDRDARRAAGELLDYLEVGRRGAAFPAKLSGGEAQRVAIARALANDPKVVLADEPTGNLDTHAGERVLEILRGLVDTQRRAVVVVTHDLALAARADRQIRIVDGKIAI